MYKTIQKLGDGVFGSVTKALDERTQEFVAIKSYRDNKVKDESKIKEIQILKKLNHPNIIKLRNVIKQNKTLAIVLDFSERNLLQYYKSVKEKNRTLCEQQIQSIVYQIASALNYLHTQGYLHRDLKPENIMIQDNGVVKLIDFGQVTYQNEQHTDYVSTRWYRSPEQIKQQSYNQEIDIWSFGCIIAELYLLTPLLPGTTEIDQLYQIQNLNLNQYSNIIPPHPLRLIKSMLQEDPHQRVTAIEILQNNWLSHPFKFLPKELDVQDDSKYLISPAQTPVKVQKYFEKQENNQNVLNHHSAGMFNFVQPMQNNSNVDEDLDCGYIPSYVTSLQGTQKKRVIPQQAQLANEQQTQEARMELEPQLLYVKTTINQQQQNRLNKNFFSKPYQYVQLQSAKHTKEKQQLD
ncbi:unnamed protein product (macronuclear) [Paramecium tetraurelia]|uniref:Protein kinase domain-containing protein n=1 Tax=Paramecium tetraurelia TaxID=5888 RepID=A0CAK7_PARTE|nr:uncharacterized protein GSPATT00036604001 [Paramecium tetraurelia]CAK67824.1 unnamed protein product [Paramecium tetraurelia]|eukprot:XP_001435221.1 hypothetical protein (macronuclear) [Paramecium tetraurelia strain d4-2]